MDQCDIVRWQSVRVNTKESILPVCDKPYHIKQRNTTEMGGDRNVAELCI